MSTLLALAVFAVVLALLRRSARVGALRLRLHLTSDEAGNEVLLVDAAVAGARSLMMVDTAYAGAPVLSTSYLAVQAQCARGDVQTRYRRMVTLLREEATDAARHAAVRQLVAGGRCRAYTSGCTMRLMGIGETSEAQADMLLCPAIAIDGVQASSRGVSADVLVTNPLRGSPHILTNDYLLHRAPCLIRPAAGLLQLGLDRLDAALLAPRFVFLAARFVGGAFVVPMRVGGAEMQIVVDTGAAAPLSLASRAAARLRTCARPARRRRTVQLGVNGERICSEMLTAPVAIAGLSLGSISLFVNSADVQGADGYAGMGLLRALDLWLEPRRIGVRLSGLPVRTPASTAAGGCDGAPSLACAA